MPSILNATTTNGLVTSADNSGSLQLQTNNGTTAVTIDTSQNVGIGTTSPTDRLHIVTNGTSVYNVFRASNANSTATMVVGVGGSAVAATSLQNNAYLWNLGNSALSFGTNDTERMRITSGGQLLVATTSGTMGTSGKTPVQRIVNSSNALIGLETTATSSYNMMLFNNGNGEVGTINTSGTGTSYGTTADYRLKENVAPMIGALDKVAQLKPVTYTWKTDGSVGQGFIAHELQEVVPDCVTGEKDAVDENGTPQYQNVDTSFLVATLTAAIQELKAELDATKAEVQALKGVA